jgi:hypothetical protein
VYVSFPRWFVLNRNAVKIILLWMAWIGILIVFSLWKIKWDWTEALLFAVSSCSTGGLLGIPSDSPEWYFGFVGAMAALGVPLMGLAMASIAAMVITIGDPDQAQKTIAAKVTLVLLYSYTLHTLHMHLFLYFIPSIAYCILHIAYLSIEKRRRQGDF